MVRVRAAAPLSMSFCWVAVGVFVMSAFTCYAWRRMMAVPGVAEGRADSVRASVACGGVCALVSAVLVVGVGVFM